MENGSKALIIAGTIIIVMMFVALGMFFFTKQGGVSGTVRKKWTDDERNTFNNQFTSYELEQKGSRVKELIVIVNESNKKFDSRVEIQGPVYQLNGVYYPSYELINSDNYDVSFVRNNDYIITTISIKKVN